MGSGGMTKNILILAVLAILMTAVIIKAVVTGRVRIAKVSSPIVRAESPAQYWLWVIAGSLAAGFLWFEIAKAISLLTAQP
jgi:hypothetical protein